MDARSWRSALGALKAVQAVDAGYRDSAELVARVRRELYRAGELADQPIRLRTISQPRDVHAVAFSPDGQLLALGCADERARMVELATGHERLSVRHGGWRSPRGEVYDVAFSPDGRWLATASADRRARLWDTNTGGELLKVTHDEPVQRVALSPNGRWLATSSDDNTARLWDTSTGSQLFKVTHSRPVWGVAFSPDGRRLATASLDDTAQMWQLIEAIDP